MYITSGSVFERVMQQNQSESKNDALTVRGGDGKDHHSTMLLWSAEALDKQNKIRAERRAIRKQIRETEAIYYGTPAAQAVKVALQLEKEETDANGGSSSYHDYDERRGVFAAPTFAPAALLKDPQRFGLLGRELNVGTGLLRKINKHPKRDELLKLVASLCFEYHRDGGVDGASGLSSPVHNPLSNPLSVSPLRNYKTTGNVTVMDSFLFLIHDFLFRQFLIPPCGEYGGHRGPSCLLNSLRE